MSTSDPKVGSLQFERLSADEKYRIATIAYLSGEINRDTWYYYIDELSDETRQIRKSKTSDKDR